MLYITCPTCNYFLGKKTIKFEENKQNIIDNPKYSNEEKEELISKLVLSLNLKRYCCKMRIMSYKDIINIIIPVNNENE